MLLAPFNPTLPFSQKSPRPDPSNRLRVRSVRTPLAATADTPAGSQPLQAVGRSFSPISTGPRWARQKWVEATVRPCGGPAVTVHGVHLVAQPLWPFEVCRHLEVRSLLKRLQRGGVAHIVAASQCPHGILARVDYVFASPDLKSALRSSGTLAPGSPAGPAPAAPRRSVAGLLGWKTVRSLGNHASDHCRCGPTSSGRQRMIPINGRLASACSRTWPVESSARRLRWT